MLSPILGYTEMMKEDLPADSPLQASMSEVLQAAERSRDLVHQLLAFARKQTLEMKPLDLNRVIEDFLKMLRRTLRENVAIETRLDPDLPLILADARQIEQVLLNLSVNGQDAMPSGGTLFISTYRTILDDEYARQHEEVKPGRFVQLAVSDTGTGIDRETLKHCFEPFFTTKERGHGTGLGLATVYGIAKQHGGHVGIYSELGQGTTVRLYLPESVEQTPLPLPVAEEAVAEPRSSGTLLLVEDEEQVRTLAAQVLARAGYSILEASSGKAAIEQMRVFSAPIDLLITDIVLPDMNGKQLYENLCSSQPGLAVLFMSGYTSDVITHHGVLDEGIDFIHKPFNIKALLAKVRQVLRQE
jgi:CheY-like chemotaxis protein